MTEKLETADESIAERRSDNIDSIARDMPAWMRTTIITIEKISLWSGRIVAWLVVPLIFSMVYEIVLRSPYFAAPTAWAYDISRMLYGAMFMLGAGYALAKGVHIRSDFLYRNWAVETQARVDLFLYVVLFIPTMAIVLWVSTEWAWQAVDRGERGMDTAWMPLLGPIKACLPAGILLLLLQGISESLKSWYAATRGRWPQE